MAFKMSANLSRRGAMAGPVAFKLATRSVTTSTFELFKIGVGPSSSHTVGPMKACNDFVDELRKKDLMDKVDRVQVDLFGSLSLTGKGHATDQACLLGLSGVAPDRVENAVEILHSISRDRMLHLGGEKFISFEEREELTWSFDRKKEHSNAMTVKAFGDSGKTLLFEETYFSIGGGFIRTLHEMHATKAELAQEKEAHLLDLHFKNMKELLVICANKQMDIAEVMHHNELHKGFTEDEVNAKLDRIWGVMNGCIERGLTSTEPMLPGRLEVKRRAPKLYQKEKHFARSNSLPSHEDSFLPLLNGMSKLSMYAIAVNEENAGGWSQIVTAPTNGASGIIPACIKHLITDLLNPRTVRQLKHLYPSYEEAVVLAPRRFLLTAAAIGALFKQNASISGAEAGCQGEVGVASSMAAAGLAACLGGSPGQVENAAEIAMEHSLGLTCDPIDGLVQIPCIERNAMGATKAMNAAALAIVSAEESHHISFDTVVEVMRQIGNDMKEEYKETALGGLALANKITRSSPAC
mmetsp:Transcript_957/g.2259  ORF Transcript_957/g.2259 Transcript_957/m.2259 type:complete len:523 (-) Transcript_957:220-1788(-)|eukprot:CAMPEP_0171520076 /NCGR_PEP_ID=MMETSP0959-20130129/6289_1 /TAXON_ID=87120 /ORGANISM="Aurantiochytrium limacinum, Strain ATCCMYA-1381" /LENGTH=522 /DNA_ID=CAMNT_0012059653 /DNA_START=64 /DNA_END=1632 /DNA_ORIENTATION=+